MTHAKPTQIPLDLGLTPPMRLGNLLVSSCNHQVITLLLDWKNWSVPVVAIYGPRRSGKTHIARAWQEHSAAIWLESWEVNENKVRDFANGINRPVVVDNADLVVDEPLFLHLYNIIRAQNQILLLTAASAPAHWGLRLPDLASRLMSAFALKLEKPDDEMIEKMLMQYFINQQMVVSSDVIAFLLPRIERNFAYLDRLFQRINQGSLAAKRKITIPFLKEVLLSMDPTMNIPVPNPPSLNERNFGS